MGYFHKGRFLENLLIIDFLPRLYEVLGRDYVDKVRGQAEFLMNSLLIGELYGSDPLLSSI